MIYGGVDIGTRKIALAIPPLHIYATLVLERLGRGQASEEDVAQAMHEMGWWIQHSVPKDVTLLVERPVLIHSRNTFARMMMTAACVMTAHQGPSSLVSNSAWKKATIGHGGATKPEVRSWLQAHHSEIAAIVGEDQDLCDAAVIAIGAADVFPTRSMSGT